MEHSVSLQECLSDFFAKVIHQPKPKEINFLQVYFGMVSNNSLYAWGRKENVPKGARLVKTAWLLRSLGFQIKEMKALPNFAWRLISIFALNQASLEEIVAATGYLDATEMYRNLLGRRPFSKQSIERISEFIRLYPKKDFIFPESLLIYNPDFRPVRSSDQVKTTKAKISFQIKPAALPALSPEEIGMVANLIKVVGSVGKVLEPFLQRLIKSDPDSRQALRYLVEGELIQGEVSLFSISNSVYRSAQLLNALCSEKSLEKSSLKQ